MIYLGHVKDGKIELDPSVRLPEGAIVRVEPVANGAAGNGESAAPHGNAGEAERSSPGGSPPTQSGLHPIDPVYLIAELAVDPGPEDLAAEHDHYLYGTPKRKGRIEEPRVYGHVGSTRLDGSARPVAYDRRCRDARVAEVE